MNVDQQELADQINAHALAAYPGLLEEWFPAGRRKGLRFVVGDLGGDRKGESVSINISTGAWKEFSGGPGGYDAIGLFAHAKCCGDRKIAFRVLGNLFGLLDKSGPVPAVKPRVPLRVVAKNDWQSIVPPPDGAGVPDLGGHTHKHVYKGQGGVILRYVARVEKADGKKDFYPHTYGVLNGEKGWHKRHPNAPMCLYGLDRLDGRAVILQEGELKSDQLQAVLPGYACLGWSGGGGQVANHDFKPVIAVPVTVVGDAVDGRDAMMKAAEIIYGLGGAVSTVDTSMFPKGWDLGNAVAGRMVKKGEVVWEDPDGPWSADKIEAFIRENGKVYDPDTGNAAPEQPADDDAEWKDDGQALDWWIKPLGHVHGVMYYLARRSWEVFALSHDQHTKMKLIGMAPLEYWNKTQFGANRKSIAWDEAADFLIRRCEDEGRYKVDTVRGRGAWLDNGRTVLHLGDQLLVDGVPQGLDLEGSRHVYEKRESISLAFGKPLKSSEANQLYELCRRLPWEKSINPKLVAGWIVTSLVCGALPWRPSIWLTGGSGAGKTTLIQDIIEPVLGGLVCKRSSTSTEAGIRQGLDGDALAVLFDEAEAESVHDRHRMQGVFDLVRQSSKEGSAPIVKGTQGQTGAKSYTLRSNFLFSSINISMNKRADESRITVVGLEATPRGDKAALQRYAELRELIRTTLTPEYRAGLLARIVGLMPVIFENVKTFSEAAAEHLGSNRAGDQIGALLAGFYALFSSKVISLEEARAFVEAQDWDDANPAEVETDEKRLIDHILQQNLTVKAGGSPYDVTVGGLILAAADIDKTISVDAANRFLLDRGIKFDHKAGGVWISNKHVALSAWLKDTPWAVNWNRALKRLEGAQASEKVIWFGVGAVQRAVFVPIGLTPLTER